jgi:hypothetical protein
MLERIQIGIKWDGDELYFFDGFLLENGEEAIYQDDDFKTDVRFTKVKKLHGNKYVVDYDANDDLEVIADGSPLNETIINEILSTLKSISLYDYLMDYPKDGCSMPSINLIDLLYAKKVS